MKTIRFGSVCSGIEAASVAWAPLGWEPAWLSEIEPFPCAVLAHHYPNVPNYGDMLKLPARIRSGEVEAPEIFCGGTPCQAFSVAGLRNSLGDARGNLSLTFCEILNAIDSIRATQNLPPAIAFYENVPGILNTSDNAFGCLLAGLAGETVPLEPPGGKWTDAGMVLGPQRAVAWRILDAQYFGLAQRRKRVFIIASARAGFNPGEILFEFDGEKRLAPPSREAGQTTTPDVNASLVGALCARDYKDVSSDNACEGKAILSPTYSMIADVTPKVTHEIAGTLRADGGGGIVPASVAYALQGAGVTSQNSHGMGHNKEVSFALNALDVHGVAVAPHVFKIRGGCEGGGKGYLGQDEQAFTVSCAQDQHVVTQYAVRRLTPVECERLQGFPDGYTNIPYRDKANAPDGPRYKALGNSWAVNVVRWIGGRINEALR